ncbi:MAG: hypothetical protein JSW65_07525 [Candidatus Bipolaricaulota bacterium]|nr:MAG: hypothetical protein JSW65_07525 [Candidatus Bipolaricaulota bacterium]
MKHRIASVGLVVPTLLLCHAVAFGGLSFGFGAGLPIGSPTPWLGSRSTLAAELFLSDSLTGFVAIDTAPATFPNEFRVHGTLAPKGWIGEAAIYVGAGPTLELTRISGRWLLAPMLHIVAGAQWWVATPLAFSLELRDVEPLPPDGAFAPIVSLGACVSLFAAPRPEPQHDWAQVWIIVGLAVAAMLLYLPRS